MILIRPEEKTHIPGIHRVEERAFKRAGEAELVDRLRERGKATLSLVALDDGKVVGHVLFSPVTLEDGENRFEVIGMGPLAVDPDCQGQGIGSRLIRAGLEEIRQAGYPAVVVLGDPAYYARFGFMPAARLGIRFSDPNAPEWAFQVIEFQRGVLEGRPGTAYYCEEFYTV